MSRIIRWHERTVSRYQHVDWAGVVAASGHFQPLAGAGRRQWEQPSRATLLADRVRSISYIAAMPTVERATALVKEVVGARCPSSPSRFRCRTCAGRSGHDASD